MIAIVLFSTSIVYILTKLDIPISVCWLVGIIIAFLILILGFIFLLMDPYVREKIINARKEAKKALSIRREIPKITEFISGLKQEILDLSNKYILTEDFDNAVSVLNEKLDKISEILGDTEYCPCDDHYSILIKALESEGITKDFTGYILGVNRKKCRLINCYFLDYNA